MADWTYAGRWALVTGASSGIGEAFARALAARAMNLVLTARREERLRALARELSAAHGVETHVVPADLGVPGAAPQVWDQAETGRDIHLLINNAGFGARGRFDEVPRERLAEMVRLNCTAVLELAHLALPGMRRRAQGGIINVASGAAFQPIPGMATYAATKAFVLSLSMALHEENRAAGVRVLALCPGTTPTEFQKAAGSARIERMPGVLSAERVVAAALRALERGRAAVVPGLVNRSAVAVTRRLPLGLATRISGGTLRRLQRAAEASRGHS